MFDHVTIRVADYEASKRFYTVVLAPLGIELSSELAFADAAGRFAEWGDFSIATDGQPVSQNVHVAFAARDNATVDAFWQAGIEAGFSSNGAPGERSEYHTAYYGAYLLDPDGNNVEAVCHNR